jgi:hypothetical protein
MVDSGMVGLPIAPLQLGGDGEEFVGLAFPHTQAAMLLGVGNRSAEGGG